MLVAAVPVIARVDGKLVPWNRRESKKWQNAASIAVHLFCREDRKFWKVHEDTSHVIMVDQAEDLLNDDTFAALEEVVLSGKVRMILESPPCRRFSMMRHFPLPDRREGPRPLRGRYGDRRVALEGLTDWELRRVKGDAILVFRMFWLQLLGEVVARRRRIRRPDSPREGRVPLHMDVAGVGEDDEAPLNSRVCGAPPPCRPLK